MEKVIKEASDFVVQLLTKELDPKFVYHSLAHTQRVVEKCNELAELSDLEEHERNLLTLAAWFHDTGYTKSDKKHELKSVEIAESYFAKTSVSSDDIQTITNLIKATEVNLEPNTDLEGMLRDADCAHLASKDYDAYASLLKKEWENTLGLRFTADEWIQNNIDFLLRHKYYSTAANLNWGKGKNKNLARLLQKQNKTKEKILKLKHKKEDLKLKKLKSDIPDRGIQTMFRVALKNHITLSDIADTKANILLSVNAIIISVALSSLIPKLDNPSNTYLIIPTLIFVSFTVICIILSVLATRPNVTKGKFTKDDVADKKVNILFFGNFHQMSYKDFDWAMQEVMEDKKYLYGNLTKDLYFLGLVLNRKYNLLRTTYTVFMIGIVLSVIAFAISFVLSGAMYEAPETAMM
jgi:predicted metal-dependent HD superfamily phosphohydrolase